MKAGIFYNSISNPAKFSNKTQLMDLFAQGVESGGDEAIIIKSPRQTVVGVDAAFILGYTLENNFRRRLIELTKQNNIPTVFVDSNILHYSRPEHFWHRYSLNGVYPNHGTYFFDEIDHSRWQTYSKWHKVTVQPWRTTGDHILIFCQRPRGWNLQGIDQNHWLEKTILNITQHTDRPIVVRLHPGDGDKQSTILFLKNKFGSAVAISNNPDIRRDLHNCWCAVGYNSTPNVVAAIEGIPVFLESPASSWANDVAFNDMALIEHPPTPDRASWLTKIANIHWSNQEVSTGKLWTAIRSYILRTR